MDLIDVSKFISEASSGTIACIVRLCNSELEKREAERKAFILSMDYGPVEKRVLAAMENSVKARFLSNR